MTTLPPLPTTPGSAVSSTVTPPPAVTVSLMPTTALAPPTPEAFADDCPSLDVVHEQAEWALDREHERSDGIDTKTSAVLAASSFIIAGMSALQIGIQWRVNALRLGTPTPWWEITARGLGGGLAVSFAVVLGFSLVAMWPRRFDIAPDPVYLRDKYLGKHERETKAKIMNARVDAYTPTLKQVDRKATCMTVAFWALACEAVLLIATLFVAAITL